MATPFRAGTEHPTPAVSGAHGIFTHLQHALWQARGQRVPLSAAVQDELSAWRHIVQELSNKPTHLCELKHFPLTWEGALDVYITGMGRRLPRPGRPVVFLGLPILHRYGIQACIGHRPQGGLENQQPVSCHSPCTSEFIPSQYTHLGPHLQSRG